ncbi:MAG: hypothetical protein ACRC3Z_07900 [Phocaeicola sp.]
MNEDEVIEKSKRYSKSSNSQRDYLAGFQAACNIVRQKYESCYNEEFCDEMEKLVQIAYLDFDE